MSNNANDTNSANNPPAEDKATPEVTPDATPQAVFDINLNTDAGIIIVVPNAATPDATGAIRINSFNLTPLTAMAVVTDVLKTLIEYLNEQDQQRAQAANYPLILPVGTERDN